MILEKLKNLKVKILGIGMLIRAIYSHFINSYFQIIDKNAILSENMILYSKQGCIAAGLPLIFGLINGQIILLAIAIDRFLAVYRPMSYNKNANKVLFLSFFIDYSCV